MAWDVPNSYSEAVEFFLRKTLISKEDFEKLDAKAKQKAFTIAKVSVGDLMQKVFDSLAKALDEGQSMRSWKADISRDLYEEWRNHDSPRLNTIYRTNMVGAYSAGRHARMADPDVSSVFSHWAFNATRDKRTTPTCRACQGVVLPADDPWWDTHYPPLHFNCRSVVTPLTARQAMARGIKGPSVDVEPADGFGARPSGDHSVEQAKFEPDREDYDRSIARHLSQEDSIACAMVELFEESKIKRDKGGQFAPKGGGGGGGSKKEPSKSKDPPKKEPESKPEKKPSSKDKAPVKHEHVDGDGTKAKEFQDKSRPRTKIDGSEGEHHGNEKIIDHAVKHLEKSGFGGFLKKAPLRSIHQMEKIDTTSGNDVSGVCVQYVDDSVSLKLKWPRKEGSWGKTFQPGKTYSVSKTAPTAIEALKSTAIHEVSHHLMYQTEGLPEAAKEAWKARKGNFLTGYQAKSPGEYFAESVALYHYHPEVLRKHDPAAWNLVQRTMLSHGMIKAPDYAKHDPVPLPEVKVKKAKKPAEKTSILTLSESETVPDWDALRDSDARVAKAIEDGRFTYKIWKREIEVQRAASGGDDDLLASLDRVANPAWAKGDDGKPYNPFKGLKPKVKLVPMD